MIYRKRYCRSYGESTDFPVQRGGENERGDFGVRGMTWDHSRGYDPLAAAAAEWKARTGEAIAWDRRSLQDFESYPVEDLARTYDLIVIDHPHVGQVAESGCLLALDTAIDTAALAA